RISKASPLTALDRVSLALIGPGRWGRILVEAVQGKSDTVTFTHAVARSPGKAEEWCREMGIALSENLTDILVDPGVDGVVLATPHSQHAQQIIQVAKAGKDLFCEKPIALSLEDARRALEAATSAGIVFMPGHNRRFLPAIAEMKARIDAGGLGKILHAEGNMSSHVGFGEVYTPMMWRVSPGESPAGGLAAAGFHLIDLLIHLLGPIAGVTAQSRRLVHAIDHDDTTSMLLRFSSGSTGYVGTMTATAPWFHLQVFGEKGWLKIDGQEELTFKPVNGPIETMAFPGVSMEQLELEAFAKAIRDRTLSPVPCHEIENGIAVFEAVISSADTESWVSW
ncbi:MAG: Gfo/Idh/MocA family oxidoreductase, partial [Pseudomonadota bacterium]